MNFKNQACNGSAVTAPAKDHLVVRSYGLPVAVTGRYRPGKAAAALTLFAASMAVAQPDAGPKNRVAISYRPGWNVKTTFSGLGGMAPQSNPGPTTGAANREYDDGYVLVDSTNSGMDLTWNWGFDNPEQVSGDTLSMRSARGLADGSASEEDFQHGFEVTYARELGTIRKARWGVEGAFNFLYVCAKSSGAVPFTVVTTVDNYDLGGIDPFTPPGSQTPNQGTFVGPGPLIPDAPSSRREESTPGGALATGKRELDANVFGLRIGPYIDFPLSAKWMLTLNAGFALAAVNSDFKFNETVSAPDLQAVSRRDSASDLELLPGGYAGANISFQATSATRVFAGAEYQHVGDFTQDAGGKRARLDLGKTVFVKVGVSFSF